MTTEREKALQYMMVDAELEKVELEVQREQEKPDEALYYRRRIEIQDAKITYCQNELKKTGR